MPQGHQGFLQVLALSSRGQVLSHGGQAARDSGPSFPGRRRQLSPSLGCSAPGHWEQHPQAAPGGVSGCGAPSEHLTLRRPGFSPTQQGHIWL